MLCIGPSAQINPVVVQRRAQVTGINHAVVKPIVPEGVDPKVWESKLSLLNVIQPNHDHTLIQSLEACFSGGRLETQKFNELYLTVCARALMNDNPTLTETEAKGLARKYLVRGNLLEDQFSAERGRQQIVYEGSQPKSAIIDIPAQAA